MGGLSLCFPPVVWLSNVIATMIRNVASRVICFLIGYLRNIKIVVIDYSLFMINCLSCRKDIPDNSNFCPYCGTKVIKINPDLKFSVGIDFNKPNEEGIKNFVEILNIKLAGVENKTQVIAALVERFRFGIVPLVKTFRNFVEVSEHDAETYMRTWFGQAYNKAAWQRAREYAPYKSWVSGCPQYKDRNDGRSRDSHLKMNGVIIPVDEYFVVPGFVDRFTKEKIPEALMMYPGDESQGPHLSQICRCRCAVGPRFLNKRKK